MFGWEHEGQIAVTQTDSHEATETIDVDIGFGIGQEIMMDLNSTHSARTEQSRGCVP